MKQQHIYPPLGGWKEQTLYLVEVSFRPNNPVHQSTFYTGFLNDGKPAGYNEIHSPGMRDVYSISDVYYMRVIRELVELKTEPAPNEYKMPNACI
jgi:hypothetical protein